MPFYLFFLILIPLPIQGAERRFESRETGTEVAISEWKKKRREKLHFMPAPFEIVQRNRILQTSPVHC